MADEHARYAELEELLATTDRITPEFASHYVNRAVGEVDRTMAESALNRVHRASRDE